MQVPVTGGIGNLVDLSASVLPIVTDADSTDNKDEELEIVTGPCDPNDKQVVPPDFITPQHVAEQRWLTYTIRFQNVGPDTAFDVIVRDTMDQLLDVPSLEVLDYSHDYEIEMHGHDMAFVFRNAMLPDSAVDEPNSRGFIKYRIKAKTSAELGDVIENTAHIYFDFNHAVITNTTQTPVDTSVHVLPPVTPAAMAPWMSVYPNPGNGIVQVKVLGLPAEPVELTAYSVLGSEIGKWNFASPQDMYNQRIQIPGRDQVVILKVTHKNGVISRNYIRTR